MRKQEVSSVSCECARTRSWCALWVSEQTLGVTRELTHRAAAIRCPTPLLLLLPSHFLLSRAVKDERKKKKRSSFPGLFREATERYLISLVSVLNSCLPFLPCMSLISCIRPSQFFLTELNLAESLIGITEHVQCLIHNAWPQPSFII